MAAQNVDIVFVVDASESMSPCFEQLRKHFQSLLAPLRQAKFKARFGLVAHAAGRDRGGIVYDHHFIGGAGHSFLKDLYGQSPRASDFFTDDPDKFCQVLQSLKPQGNENTLLALDIALDFPFGSLQNTKRVVAVLSDEKLEDGIEGDVPISKIPELVQKIQARHVQLFASMPSSDGANLLAEVDRSEFEPVDGGDGLARVDFKLLLGQMGKSISIPSLQTVGEPLFKRALFGQDAWGSERSASAATRQVILKTGESARLNIDQPIEWIKARLAWTAKRDLDLHAFYRTKDGSDKHVFFGNKIEKDVNLDVDAGVGDRGGQNVENMGISSLENIEAILFATNIYKWHGGESYADYDGKVVVTTNNGDDITVPLSSQQRAAWCVIAKIDNRGQGPEVVNVNAVTESDPNVSGF